MANRRIAKINKEVIAAQQGKPVPQSPKTLLGTSERNKFFEGMKPDQQKAVDMITKLENETMSIASGIGMKPRAQNELPETVNYDSSSAPLRDGDDSEGRTTRKLFTTNMATTNLRTLFRGMTMNTGTFSGDQAKQNYADNFSKVFSTTTNFYQSTLTARAVMRDGGIAGKLGGISIIALQLATFAINTASQALKISRNVQERGVQSTSDRERLGRIYSSRGRL